VDRFVDRLQDRCRERDSLVCVGLDVDPARVPEALRGRGDWVYEFNRGIIEATEDLVCAYKPNLAFYEALGGYGLDALTRTMMAMPRGVIVIGDAKRGDIGHTARAYARAMFDILGFDAVTVNPYLGHDSVAPFLEYSDRGVLVLCKTSNPGSGDFQDLVCEAPEGKLPLYQLVAQRAAGWDRNGNIGLVVGATYPEELATIRGIAPDLPILIPGVGAQAGDLAKTVQYGTDSAGEMAIINSSRGIIHVSQAANWKDAARQAVAELRDSINEHRALKRGQAGIQSGE
jgi:orotidine-5'-phosphate decarboxylase